MIPVPGFFMLIPTQHLNYWDGFDPFKNFFAYNIAQNFLVIKTGKGFSPVCRHMFDS